MSETLPTLREAPDRFPASKIRELLDEPPKPAGEDLQQAAIDRQKVERATYAAAQAAPPAEMPPSVPQTAPLTTEPVAAGETPSDEEVVAETPQEESAGQPEDPLAATADDELLNWLAEPDETDVTDAELTHDEPEEPETWATADDQYSEPEVDPALLEERRKRIAAEKKIAHIESLRAQDAAKSWREEALKVFPKSAHALDSIQATSRKGFLRAAKAEHEKAEALIAQYLPAEAEVRAQAAADARAEEQTKAAEAWGKHPGSGPGVPPASADKKREIEEAREMALKGHGLKNLFKAMF